MLLNLAQGELRTRVSFHVITIVVIVAIITSLSP